MPRQPAWRSPGRRGVRYATSSSRGVRDAFLLTHVAATCLLLLPSEPPCLVAWRTDLGCTPRGVRNVSVAATSASSRSRPSPRGACAWRSSRHVPRRGACHPDVAARGATSSSSQPRVVSCGSSAAVPRSSRGWLMRHAMDVAVTLRFWFPGVAERYATFRAWRCQHPFLMVLWWLPGPRCRQRWWSCSRRFR